MGESATEKENESDMIWLLGFSTYFDIFFYILDFFLLYFKNILTN